MLSDCVAHGVAKALARSRHAGAFGVTVRHAETVRLQGSQRIGTIPGTGRALVGAGALLRHAPLFIDMFTGIAMQAKTIAVLLAASAAFSAIHAFADDCATASMHCRGAVAPVSHDTRAVHAMSAKPITHVVPDAATSAVGGADTYRMQAGKREQRDSIDAWYRGG
ncbi:hypothetical protein BTHE68_61480 (plasmid) [Burkholderia sp. THE68]|nr:hypothetical protein BTHE68_61480 [Burkholderia sp. THE68]